MSCMAMMSSATDPSMFAVVRASCTAPTHASSKVATFLAEQKCLAATQCALPHAHAHAHASSSVRRSAPSSWRSHDTHRAIEPRPPSKINADIKTRSMNAILNKANETNVKAMLAKLNKCITEAVVSRREACQFILTKCYTEDAYLNVYIKLIYDMYMGDSQHVISAEVDGFIECVLKEIKSYRERRSDHGDDVVELYDVFCDRLKQQKHMRGRVRTIMGLIDVFPLELAANGREVFNVIAKELCQSAKDPKGCSDAIMGWCIDALDRWPELLSSKDMSDVCIALTSATFADANAFKIRCRAKDILERVVM